jgi:hypothetical protein
MPRAANALSPQAVLTGLLRYLEGSGALTQEDGEAIVVRANLHRIHEGTDRTLGTSLIIDSLLLKLDRLPTPSAKTRGANDQQGS